MALNKLLTTESKARLLLDKRKLNVPDNLSSPKAINKPISPISIQKLVSTPNMKKNFQVSTSLYNPIRKPNKRSMTDTNFNKKLHQRLIILGQTGSDWLVVKNSLAEDLRQQQENAKKIELDRIKKMNRIPLRKKPLLVI